MLLLLAALWILPGKGAERIMNTTQLRSRLGAFARCLYNIPNADSKYRCHSLQIKKLKLRHPMLLSKSKWLQN
jgi:hypothetical protein